MISALLALNLLANPIAPPVRSQAKEDADALVNCIINSDFDLGLSSWKRSGNVARGEESGRTFARLGENASISQRCQAMLFRGSAASKYKKTLPIDIEITAQSEGGGSSELVAEIVSQSTGGVLYTTKLSFGPTSATQKFQWSGDKMLAPRSTALRIRAVAGATKIFKADLNTGSGIAAYNDAIEDCDPAKNLGLWYTTIQARPGSGTPADGTFLRMKTVLPKGDKPWGEQIAREVAQPIHEGDVVMFNFSARSPTQSTMTLRYSLNGGNWAEELEKRIVLTKEWRQYSFKGVVTRDYAAKESLLTFWLGYGPGFVDLRDLHMWWY